MVHAARRVLRVGGSLVACAAGVAGCVSYGTQQTANVSVVANVTAATVNNGGPRLDQVPDVPTVPGARVDGATIRATLDLHGSWVEDATYGTMWIPSAQEVGAGFVPYGTNGQWTLTDAGWYWQSSLAWGWLTFHYGRWVLVEEQWGWVPGAMFAPAWVDWRVGNSWIGWAPLPPRGAAFTAPYVFCHERVFGTPGFWSSVVYGAGAVSLYGSTVSLPGSYGVGGAVYAWGPPPATRTSGGPVATPVSLTTAWRGEFAPRAGAPIGGGGASSGGGAVGGGTGGMARAGVPSETAARTGVPVGGAVGGGAGAIGHGAGAPSAALQAGTMLNEHPLRPGESAPVRAPAPGEGAGRWAPVPVDPVAPYPSTGNFGRYRAPDAVVIRGSVPESSGPIRHTVSLGTAEGSVPSSAPWWGGGSGTSYAAPSDALGPSRASTGAGVVAPPAAVSAVPSNSWAPPAPSSMPPAYAPSGGAYAAPAHVGASSIGAVPAVAPAYAPPASTGYAGGGWGGPAAVPGYAPAYAAPSPAPAASPVPHYAPAYTQPVTAPVYTQPVAAPPVAAPHFAPAAAFSTPATMPHAPSAVPSFVGHGAFGRWR